MSKLLTSTRRLALWTAECKPCVCVCVRARIDTHQSSHIYWHTAKWMLWCRGGVFRSSPDRRRGSDWTEPLHLHSITCSTQVCQRSLKDEDMKCLSSPLSIISQTVSPLNNSSMSTGRGASAWFPFSWGGKLIHQTALRHTSGAVFVSFSDSE